MGPDQGTFGTVSMFDNKEYVNTVVHEIARTTPPPYPSVKWVVIEHPDGDPCLMLVLYLENFAEHSTPQQTSIGEWAGVVIMKIRKAGIPCYLMRVSENDL